MCFYLPAKFYQSCFIFWKQLLSCVTAAPLLNCLGQLENCVVFILCSTIPLVKEKGKTIRLLYTYFVVLVDFVSCQICGMHQNASYDWCQKLFFFSSREYWVTWSPTECTVAFGMAVFSYIQPAGCMQPSTTYSAAAPCPMLSWWQLCHTTSPSPALNTIWAETRAQLIANSDCGK